MILPLSSVPPGTVVRVVDVDAGFGLRTRLINMGFVKGAKVKVIENSGCQILVSIGGESGRVVALSRGIANKILVEVEVEV